MMMRQVLGVEEEVRAIWRAGVRAHNLANPVVVVMVVVTGLKAVGKGQILKVAVAVVKKALM